MGSRSIRGAKVGSLLRNLMCSSVINTAEDCLIVDGLY